MKISEALNRQANECLCEQTKLKALLTEPPFFSSILKRKQKHWVAFQERTTISLLHGNAHTPTSTLNLIVVSVDGPGSSAATSTGTLVGSCLCVLEELLGQVHNGQWARNADRRADLDDGEVPTADTGYKTETTGDLEEVEGACDTGSGGVGRDVPLCSSEAGEERNKADEGEQEGDVGAEGTNGEDGADAHAVDVLVYENVVCKKM